MAITITGGHMSRFVISATVLSVLLLAGMFLAPRVVAETEIGQEVTTAVSAQVDPNQNEETPPRQETPLPAGLSRIFASLGLFIVTMFTMAIGTEIMVDVFKLILGLKSKPSAMKTIKEYEALLPGKLENLGLAAEAQLQVQNQLAALRSILAPAFRAERLVINLREQNFTAALAEAGLSGQSEASMIKARDTLKEQIRTAVAGIERRSVLAATLGDNFLSSIEQAIDERAASVADITPEELFEFGVMLLNAELAEGMTNWLETQVNYLHRTSYETAQQIYDSQIKKLIEDSGLNEEIQGQIKSEFSTFLNSLKTYQGSIIFLEAVNNLLLDVERQRNELRSYLSKIWMKIRDYSRALFSKWFDIEPITPETQSIQIQHPAEAASKLMKVETRDKNEEKKRIERLRFVSVLVALLLAYLLQIDAADLLRDLFPADANFLSITLIESHAPLFASIGNLFNLQMNPLTAGIILTGLAASAGSSFWHDQLNRLQAVKKGTESAYATLQPIIVAQQKERET
jgi:hypothetical protein